MIIVALLVDKLADQDKFIETNLAPTLQILS